MIKILQHGVCCLQTKCMNCYCHFQFDVSDAHEVYTEPKDLSYKIVIVCPECGKKVDVIWRETCGKMRTETERALIRSKRAV